MKRVLLVIAVAVLVGLAGCATDPGDSNDTVEEETPSDTATEEDGTDSSDDGTDPPPDLDGDLELHHIDVGQADSTVIVTPNDETILIDTGDWRQDGADVIAYLDDLGIERIDHLVGTHPHADHIGGHAAVIEYFEENHDGIGNIYDSGLPHDTQTFENYLDAVEKYDHELLVVAEGDELPLESDAVEALVLNPPAGDSGDDFHYNSVVIVIEFGDFRYLTTGDTERAAEQRLVDEWADELDADTYQAGHHGSSTSSTPAFVDTVAPEHVVVSSDFDSQYGHPHDETLELFADRDLETYWTGVHGDIVVRTDGDEITVETEEEFSTDPEDLLAEKPDDDAARITPSDWGGSHTVHAYS